jgi:Trypsin-like peptidase domain
MTGQDTIRNVVLPIVEVEGTPPNLAYKRLLGSGFLIGGSAYLLTAAHVFRPCQPGYAVALRVVDGRFETIQLENIIEHPTEDVAICSVKIPNHVISFLQPSSMAEHQSADCHVWGYPSDVLYDSGETVAAGRTLQRPELIFMKGYIRRRVTRPIPPFKGSQFYEINDSAGAGCSGAPMIVFPTWRVCGVYMGEVTSEQGGNPIRSRGYAVRMEAVADWLRALNPNLVV